MTPERIKELTDNAHDAARRDVNVAAVLSDEEVLHLLRIAKAARAVFDSVVETKQGDTYCITYRKSDIEALARALGGE